MEVDVHAKRKEGRNMKKMTVLALCLAAALSLSACAGTTSSKTTSSKTTSTASTASVESKADESKADESKKEESKADESKADESKVDESKADESKPSLVASKGSEADESTEETPVVGGWTASESPVVTDEIKEKLAKATDGVTGATYVPVAYLGSQVVAGKNYKLLCRETQVYPGAVETYSLVTLYEDLDGNVKISDVEESYVETHISAEEADGAWTEPETPEVSDEDKAVLAKATETLTGAEYKAVALLSTQVVAGKNYCYLCEETPVVPDAQSKYVIAYASVDPEGTTVFGGSSGFDIDEQIAAAAAEVEAGLNEAAAALESGLAEAKTELEAAAAELESAVASAESKA